MKTFFYFLPNGKLALQIKGKDLNDAKTRIRQKHNLARLPKNFEIWEQLINIKRIKNEH